MLHIGSNPWNLIIERDLLAEAIVELGGADGLVRHDTRSSDEMELSIPRRT